MLFFALSTWDQIILYVSIQPENFHYRLVIKISKHFHYKHLLRHFIIFDYNLFFLPRYRFFWLFFNVLMVLLLFSVLRVLFCIWWIRRRNFMFCILALFKLLMLVIDNMLFLFIIVWLLLFVIAWVLLNIGLLLLDVDFTWVLLVTGLLLLFCIR